MSHSFFSWRFRQLFLASILSFIAGFLVAWLLCSDTFRYMFALMFAN